MANQFLSYCSHLLRKKVTYIILLLMVILSPVRSYAQVTITPASFTGNDTVTILFNAALGNAALAGYTGTVYMHTGLITPASTSTSDWQNVVDNWGTADTNTQMTSLGGNLYTKTVFIPTYYGINCTTEVDSLAFVFRNVDGSIVGRDSSGGDIFVAAVPVSASPNQNDFVSYYQQGNLLRIIGTNGVMTMNVYQSGVSVMMQQDTTVAADTSFAIVDTMLQPLVPVVGSNASFLFFPFDSANTVLIRKNPMEVLLVQGSDTLFSEQPGWQLGTCGGTTAGAITNSFSIQNQEAFFGGGSRPGTVNLFGKTLQFYNQAQGGFNNTALNINIGIPFFVSSRGYGILFDNHIPGSADIGQTNPSLFTTTFEGGPMRYFLVPGTSYAQIMQRYAATTGYHPLPPVWAMGYIQSKYGFQTDSEASSVVSLMRQDDFPMDAIVLDLYWYGNAGNMGNISWASGQWPDPVGMMQSFRDSGVKTILIVEPYITQASTNYNTAVSNGYFAKNSLGQPYILSGFWAGSAALLDITNPAALPWFSNLYNQRINEGVGGWWSDLGEPEDHPDDMVHYGGTARQVHNIYALTWEQMLYNNYRQQYPNTRLFNLCRSGSAGMQRYNTFPWSGDVERSWSGLQAQIPVMVSMGMSGVGYMHQDVGGFTNGPQDNELYERWQQVGAFSPVDRAHGQGVPTVPVYYPSDVQDNVRTFIKLRMSLLPYNYSLAWQNTTTGAPLVRPLFYDAGFGTQYTDVSDEYLWGPNVLVAPIMGAGLTSRQVVLPPGTWFDWWTGQQYAGSSTVSINAPLTIMPLMIRGDAFLPQTSSVKSTDYYKGDTLLVNYYPADATQTAAFTVYLDDGADPYSLSLNRYRTMSFTGNHGFTGSVALSVNLAQQGGFTSEPARRSLSYVIHNFSFPAGDSVIIINGVQSRSLTPVASMNAFQSADSVYFYDSANRVLYAKYTVDHNNSLFEITGSVLAGVPVLPGAHAADFTLLPPFPNPCYNNINVQCDVYQPGPYTISIRNIVGQEVYTQAANLAAGYQAINCPANLASGNYVVTVKGISSAQHQRVVLVH